MYKIPDIVEEIPIVAFHEDLTPYNMIVSSEDLTHIAAIIDWEFLASALYGFHHIHLETFLIRRWKVNGFGDEYPGADELRHAFWDAIPEWKKLNDSEAVQVLLEWWRFALFLKAESPGEDLSAGDRDRFWRENIRVVEGFLAKWAGDDWNVA
jgi:hypothetical protein